MHNLKEILLSHGISIEPNFTGVIQRNEAQWFVGRLIELSGGVAFQQAYFGDWSRGLVQSWDDRAGGLMLSAAQITEMEEKLKALQDEHAKLKAALQEEAAIKAQKFVASLKSEGTTPYLDRKQVKLFHAKIYQDTLIVPLKDTEGKLWNYQRIYPNGDKRFTKGGRIDGLYHVLQSGNSGESSLQTSDDRRLAPNRMEENKTKPSDSCIYIGEGFSTAASCAMALGPSATVLCAFNAQNLPKVVSALSTRDPSLRIIVLADNDQWGDVNTGLIKGTEAVSLCDGEIRFPTFSDEHSGSRPTDFNDLHLLAGLDEVRKQISNAPSVKTPATEKPKKMSEHRVLQEIQRQFGDRLIKQGVNDFYHYDGKSWKHLLPGENDFIWRKIATIMGPKASTREIDSAWRYYNKHAEKPPRGVNMMAPSWTKINFQNGTMRAEKNLKGEYELTFGPHSPYDYLTQMLPFEFPGFENLNLYQNEKFDTFLAALFPGDADEADKLRAIQQLFGCALMPIYSRVFFLIGPPQSGKSTVGLLLSMLIGEENTSRVSPSSFNGFHMAGMINKSVNFDLDLSIRKPIDEEVLKKIVDRAPFPISRKFQETVGSPLPPVHVFAANDFPKSLEGISEAFDRRMIVIRFQKPKLQRLELTWNYEREIWAGGQLAVVAYAIKGLMDLLARRGHFSEPASSVRELRRWTQEQDLAEQFIEDLEKGLFNDQTNRFIVHQDAKIERTLLSEKWIKYARDHQSRTGRNHFFKTLRGKGYQETAINGTWYFKGIGVMPVESSHI